MSRNLTIASTVAVAVVLVAAAAIIVQSPGGGGVAGDEYVDADSSGQRLAGSARNGGRRGSSGGSLSGRGARRGSGSSSSRVPRDPEKDDRTPLEGATPGMVKTATGSEASSDKENGAAKPGDGNGDPESAESKKKSEKGKGGDDDRGRLTGAALTAALEAAIESAVEAEDLGPLQGLLISELTHKGSRLSPDHLPMLFEALETVDDYGLESLALTHLERIDAPESDLRDGYLDFLANSPRSKHGDTVLDRLVEMGGDETAGGLVELFRASENHRQRHQLAEAIGKIGSERGVPTLREALFATDGSTSSARPYLEALARIGGRSALTSVLDFVATPGNENASHVIREIRDAEGASILAHSLSRQASRDYLRSALRQIGQIAEPSTLPELDRFLENAPEERLVLDALSSLGRFSDPRAARILESYARHHPDSKYGSYALKLVPRIERNRQQQIERAERQADSERRDAERRQERTR